MGPVWMHAKELSGMQIDQNIWLRDPPGSSYPACIAVKAAGIQSREAEENVLRLLREAVMLKGENIAKKEVLHKVGERAGDIDTSFDVEKFRHDCVGDAAVEAFRKDLAEVQMKHISRFPSLVIKSDDKAILIAGCHPYAYITQQLKHLMGTALPTKEINVENYKRYWPSVTQRELDEVDFTKEK